MTAQEATHLRLKWQLRAAKFRNLTPSQFVQLATESGFVNSPMDTALSKVTKSHPGQNMRSATPFCSVHLNILPVLAERRSCRWTVPCGFGKPAIRAFECAGR